MKHLTKTAGLPLSTIGRMFGRGVSKFTPSVAGPAVQKAFSLIGETPGLARTQALSLARQAPAVQAAERFTSEAPSAIGGYFRGMAGLKPGQNFADKPIKSVANALTTPFWDPFIRQNHPRLATGLRYGAAAPVIASATAGTVAMPFVLRQNTGKVSYLTARHAGFDQPNSRDISDRIEGNFPSIVKNTLPSSIGGDPTAIGDIHRDVVSNTAWPYARSQLNHVIEHGPVFTRNNTTIGKISPYLGKTIDTLRSTTPIGALMTAGMYGAKNPRQPDYNRAIISAILKHRDRLNPSDIISSPLLQTYTNAVLPSIRNYNPAVAKPIDPEQEYFKFNPINIARYINNKTEKQSFCVMLGKVAAEIHKAQGR